MSFHGFRKFIGILSEGKIGVESLKVFQLYMMMFLKIMRLHKVPNVREASVDVFQIL